MMFTVAQIDLSVLLPRFGERQKMASFRCVGLRREGPGEESPGKDLMAFSTASSLILIQSGEGEGGREGEAEGGCFASISERVSGDEGDKP